MFDRILNVGIIAWRKSEEKFSTAGVTQENLGLPLPPNSFDLHQEEEELIY